jgi:hypothetical protein
MYGNFNHEIKKHVIQNFVNVWHIGIATWFLNIVWHFQRQGIFFGVT